ncbi:hypothetical protein llg_31010 [Luteolibacter sp. LG18]|nr:hypothetical protein llg_31010 [Luteolibacter sp. LG18]
MGQRFHVGFKNGKDGKIMKNVTKMFHRAAAGFTAGRVSLSVAVAAVVCGITVCHADEVKLDVNDVSFLWPVAKTAAEVDQLISMDDPGGAADGPIWPEDLFRDVIDNQSAKAKVGGFQIGFASELRNAHNWKVVGIRVNPCSLGGDDAHLARVGQVPGIRLIVQPVTVKDGVVTVHDYAAHLAFNYVVIPGDLGKLVPFVPDNEAFGPIVEDLKEIKALASETVPTNGKLGVHPGFAIKGPRFRERLKTFLHTRLSRERLQVISFMGLPEGDPEPWIFFSVFRLPKTPFMLRQIGGFPPVPFGAPPAVGAQMLVFKPGVKPHVQPAFKADAGQGTGVSTAVLFEDDIGKRLNDPAFVGTPGTGLADMKIKDIPDFVANPARSNTMSMDCVSCHTDTTRKTDLDIDPENKPTAFTFRAAEGISGVDESGVPKRAEIFPVSWNVRNFGWFPDFFKGGAVSATVSRRAANEAAESADFINRHPIPIKPVSPASGGSGGIPAVAPPGN